MITVLPSPEPMSKSTSPALNPARLSMYSTTLLGLGTKGAINKALFPPYTIC
jgi:hypothetical protein